MQYKVNKDLDRREGREGGLVSFYKATLYLSRWTLASSLVIYHWTFHTHSQPHNSWLLSFSRVNIAMHCVE